VVRDFAADPTTVSWREEATKRGYMSCICIPFRHFEGEMACLTAYGVRVSRWSDPERRLMDQVASALGFGITTLRTGLAKAQFQENLRVSLEETILVVAGTLEQRDPYTAGHQRRVADLCVHIAEAMGLSADRTHGLQLAANIHDLGKIGTPTELLTKPGRLSKAEFSLIKDHAEMGYEIIKKVHFPWPIADMVRQHHERLDGSGYPLGLKAEATLLESRILAVADVVEAMSSQRPYRPSLGIDAALDNILAGRGTQFEPEVVDACVSLFRVEGYHLPA
jgi:HD-GYP domain-containing protein (c-di-GMP phosphodiesterase class II)